MPANEPKSLVEISFTSWQKDDSLLQQYRGISLTIQYFIMVIATLISSNIGDSTQLKIFFAGIVIVDYRGRIVDYHKRIVHNELNDNQKKSLRNISSAEEYSKWLHRRINFYEYFGEKYMTNSITITKMDRYVPFIYVFLWIFLIYYVLLIKPVERVVELHAGAHGNVEAVGGTQHRQFHQRIALGGIVGGQARLFVAHEQEAGLPVFERAVIDG